MENLITPELKVFIDFIQAGGFITLLIILAFPNLRKKFGFQNGSVKQNKEDQDVINERVRDTLEDHKKHLKVANQEMGEIRDSVKEIRKDVGDIKNKQGNIETDIGWIKDKLNN